MRAAKAAASSGEFSDGESGKELSFLENCRPFGLRRLVDSAILFGTLRSFLASDARLVAALGKRPGAAAALPAFAYIFAGWYLDKRSFRCYLPAFASATELGVRMRAAYRTHSNDALLAAAEHVASLPIGGPAANSEERRQRGVEMQRLLSAKPAGQVQHEQQQKQTQRSASSRAEPHTAAVGASAGEPGWGGESGKGGEPVSGHGEGGWGLESSSIGSEDPWRLRGGEEEEEENEESAQPPLRDPLDAVSGEGGPSMDGWRGPPLLPPAPAAPRPHMAMPDTPFDFLFGGEGAASAHTQPTPTPAASFSAAGKVPSYEERRERRERRQQMGEDWQRGLK